MEYIVAILAIWVIYDKYIQREHQLLINYPVIGRFRYLFEILREPFRQYFGDEEFYESRDKVDWVYDAAKDKKGFVSFSPKQPQQPPKFLIKHANVVLENEEVSEDFSIAFGERQAKPFRANSIIFRSAMSDGAISPEGTRAFVKGAYDGRFPINSGEGSITSNFFFTFEPKGDEEWLEFIHLSSVEKRLFTFIKAITNRYIAIRFFRRFKLDPDIEETYIFSDKLYAFFRVNWDAPLEVFPKDVPKGLPDIIYQISSGLYGAKDRDGNFDPIRFQKTVSFAKMVEIKVAQGAKQTGGKLVASKVTPAIAYYRGVEPYKDLFSPNRFPFVKKLSDYFDFVATLQGLSSKPVGLKLVISSKEGFEEIVQEMKMRIEHGLEGVPDFLSIDGGEGGSATAPLYLMERVGIGSKDAIFIADKLLRHYGIRDRVKLIASSKILTPDDVVIMLSLGADAVQIARGFMMSAGCIRARVCSGEGKHQCPVGLATQDRAKRRSYLVYKHAKKVATYHKNLLKNIRALMAVMGVRGKEELNPSMLSFMDKNGYIHEGVNRYMSDKHDI